MNIREMQYQFGIQLNQFGEALQLNSDDIQYWLNKAQINLVKEKYNGFNRKQISFEQSQQRIDDLRVLVKRDEEIDTYYENNLSGTDGFYADRADFPQDYMFLVSHKSCVLYNYPFVEYEVVDGKREADSGKFKVVSNRVALSDHIYKLLSDPFNKPKPSSPISVIHDDSISIFTDKTFIVYKLIIDYLKKPIEMNIKEGIDCELPDHLHEEIIQRAADLFLNNTRELKQRLQRETPIADQTTNTENNE